MIRHAVNSETCRCCGRSSSVNGQAFLRAVKDLNLRPLVATQHQGAFGRIQIQADDLPRPPGTGRLDANAVAYWELRNLGFGEQAARNDAGSVVRQAQVRRLAVMDQVAREVTEAAVQSEARRRQIEIARQGVQAAVDSHRRNLARIEAAKGLPIEALQSVQALAFAQREYLRALADYDAAQFTLYRARSAGLRGSTSPPPSGRPSRSGIPAALAIT